MNAPSLTLAPVQIAGRLFVLVPDRDERASQLCSETLLTLSQNGYQAPGERSDLRSPKRMRFAIRSLALGRNFLESVQGRAAAVDLTPEKYGQLLASGRSFLGADNLHLVRDALQGLADATTQYGQAGTWLLRPFHESLLWFDARRSAGSPWGVRKVYMRGTGITLARLLADPPKESGLPAAASGKAALAELDRTLTAPSPLARVADHLEAPLPEQLHEPPKTERDELDAWNAGEDARLAVLATSLCRHAEGVLLQAGASGPDRLWQFRNLLALEVAAHVLRRAWEVTSVPNDERYLLLSFGSAPRAQNVVRQLSEASYQRARIRVDEATVHTLADAMLALAELGVTQWAPAFVERRGRRLDVVEELGSLTRTQSPSRTDLLRIARRTAEQADYGRPGHGFRVLLESIKFLAGGTRYRYLAPGPEMLACFVGAMSADMPMSSDEFFRALFDRWGLVVNQEAASETDLRSQVDGAALERNARAAEQLMVEAGLALSLSDRTTVVGERARWSR